VTTASRIEPRRFFMLRFETLFTMATTVTSSSSRSELSSVSSPRWM
jgi:hypothetical protein